MSGQIVTIYIAAQHGEAQSATPNAQLTADVGLEGDRYAGTGVVSLIEAEAIEAFRQNTGIQLDAAETRRNIVTSGIDLNALVGQRFQVADATLEGFELCEPCAMLGELLATESVRPADVVKHFARSAGLRARVISSGAVEVGSSVGVATN